MLSLFNWNEGFLTHISSVDEQHRKLVELINDLGEMIFSSDTLDPLQFIPVRDTLFNYVHQHFVDEESIMAAAELDPRHCEPHILAHQAFLAEALVLGDITNGFSIDEARRLVDYLINWLAYHILGMDQTMAKQVVAVEKGESAATAYETEAQSARYSSEPLLAAMSGLFYMVSERNRELRSLNRELEMRVKERTQALEAANHRLQLLSTQDDLTKLPNRRFAYLSLDQQWQERVRYQTPLAVLMIDADQFKAVNDNFGHAMGDALICEIGRRIRSTVRASDIVCRLGGDEFLVICPRTDHAGATELARKIVAASLPFQTPEGVECWRGALSIGTAEADATMSNPEALLAAADRAMYSAKRQGGARVS